MSELNMSNILLSTSRALWGSVTSNMRAISVAYEEASIILYFYYQEEPTELDGELSEIVSTEISADFPELKNVEVKNILAKYPTRVPQEGMCVFCRYEPTPSVDS